jgi:hypothetical protein
MNHTFRLIKVLLWAVCLLGAVTFVNSMGAADKKGTKIEITLVWGTDMAESPNEKHKQLDPDLAKKLHLFKWKNYFQVNQVAITVPAKGSAKQKLSDKCEVQMKDLGNSNFEVDLWGEDKHVIKKSQKITKGELLTIGGDVKKSDGAWFILIRETE